MMFAILFGLSMDYEVFLLSRVREQFLRHGDSSRAVVEGLARTARVITAAAAIMVVVFLAFLATPEVFLKLMGIGMATAIFVDATIVRMVLVPAVMQLLGRANWWLPGWLDRRLPRLDVERARAGRRRRGRRGDPPPGRRAGRGVEQRGVSHRRIKLDGPNRSRRRDHAGASPCRSSGSTRVTVVLRRRPPHVAGRRGQLPDNYGGALWWSAQTVTTVGYGDVVPTTTPAAASSRPWSCSAASP